MVANVETMMYARDGGIPWHKLGTPVETAATMSEAVEASGLGWKVIQRPVFVLMEDGRQIETDRVANVRETDGKVMGIVSKGYQVFQNVDGFFLFDQIARETGFEARWETAGSLDGGKKVFMSLRLPNDLKLDGGDVSYLYWLLTNGHDGGTALDIFPTNVRVVCWNTFSLAHSYRTAGLGLHAAPGERLERVTMNEEALDHFSFRHVGDMDVRLDGVRQALQIAAKQTEAFCSEAEGLAGIAASHSLEDEFESIIFPPIVKAIAGERRLGILPAPEAGRYVDIVPADYFARATLRRDVCVEVFHEVYAEEPKTAWGLFNAATGYADHKRPHRWSRSDAAMKSAIWGSGAELKERAFDGIRTLTGVRA